MRFLNKKIDMNKFSPFVCIMIEAEYEIIHLPLMTVSKREFLI